MYISPQFDCRRMVREYMTELYEPAHEQHVRRPQRQLRSRAREGALERAHPRGLGPGAIRGERPGAGAAVTSGTAVPVRAAIDLAGLKPDDVRVEMVLGRIDSNGHLEDTEVMVLPPVEQQGAVAVFGKDIVPERTGRLGYALRVSPNHFDDPLTRPCSSLLKWSSV